MNMRAGLIISSMDHDVVVYIYIGQQYSGDFLSSSLVIPT